MYQNTHLRVLTARGLATAALCGLCCTASLPSVAHALPQAPVEVSDKEVQAQFVALVAKFEKVVTRAKKQAYSAEGELNQLKKRVEAAGWRVTAARDRFDKTQSELASTSEPSRVNKLKQKLAADKRLLEDDASKLAKLMKRSESAQATSVEILELLRPLKDDVAIEADRFEPNEPGQKKAVSLLADADWAVERLEALTEALKAEFDAPANEVLERAQVK